MITIINHVDVIMIRTGGCLSSRGGRAATDGGENTSFHGGEGGGEDMQPPTQSVANQQLASS